MKQPTVLQVNRAPTFWSVTVITENVPSHSEVFSFNHSSRYDTKPCSCIQHIVSLGAECYQHHQPDTFSHTGTGKHMPNAHNSNEIINGTILIGSSVSTAKVHAKQTSNTILVHREICLFHKQWSYTLLLCLIHTYQSRTSWSTSPDPGRKNRDSFKTVSFTTSLGGDFTSDSPVYVCSVQDRNTKHLLIILKETHKLRTHTMYLHE